MKGSSVVALVTACALSSTGCNVLSKLRRGKEDAGAGASVLTAPPKPQLRDDGITFDAKETKAKVYTKLDGTSFEVTFFDFPPGSKVSVGATPIALSPEGFATTKLDITPRLLQLPPKDALDAAFKLDPQVKVTLEFNPQAKLTVDLPPFPTAFPLKEYFKKMAGKPVAFGPGPKSGQHSALFLDSTKPEAFGPARALGDIDVIAIPEIQPPHAGKKCGGYKKIGETTGPDRSFELQLIDDKVSLFDLRSGKALGQKVIAAPNQCPTAALGGVAKSYAAAEDSRRWVKQQLAVLR